MSKFIDTDSEYHQVLFELELLNDDDDWDLFCQLETDSVDFEIYKKYVRLNGREYLKDASACQHCATKTKYFKP